MDPSKYIKLSDLILDESKIGKSVTLQSGSKNFDKVLGGGFKSGINYLVFGPNKTGKTQLCHQLCIQSYKQFSNQTNDGFEVFYIDTENTFRPERLIQLAEIQDLDYKKMSKKILISKIVNNKALLLTLNNIEGLLEKSSAQHHLLLIDSINNYYRSEVGDKNIPFEDTKSTFLKILKKIDYYTRKFSLISVATAQISSNFVDGAIIRELPVGNQFLNHFYSESLYLSYREEEQSFAHLVNSDINPEKKVLYQITSKGIEDYKF